MAHVNFQRSLLRFKIVYYGPDLCGKTTNLEELHKMFGGNVELVSLQNEGDRTIFFDYMPLNLGKLGNIETVFRIYTVSGQVRDNKTRKMVLRDVDGIVFVADSRKEEMPNNVESLFSLEENLAQEGVELSSLPMVIQYNKRDLDDIVSIERMEAELNQAGRPFFAASAHKGENVKKTLLAIAQQVYEVAAERYGLADPVERKVDGEDNWSSISMVPPPPPAEKISGTPQPSDRVVDSSDEQISLLKSQFGEIREEIAEIGIKIDDLRADLSRKLIQEADKCFSDYLEDVEETSAPNEGKKPPGAG
jgi:signal recognition particle receptor subunit beta